MRTLELRQLMSLGALACLLAAVCPLVQSNPAMGASELDGAQEMLLLEAKELHIQGWRLALDGRTDEAIGTLLEARSLLDGPQPSPLVSRRAKISLQLASVHANLGRYDEAEGWWLEARTDGALAGNDKVLLDAASGLAWLYTTRDRPDHALEEIRAAATLAEAMHEGPRLGILRYQEAAVLDRQGLLSDAMDGYLSASETLLPFTRTGAVAHELTDVGQAAAEVSREERFFVASRVRIAKIASKVGYPEEALSDLQVVLKMPDMVHPSDMTEYLGMAASLSIDAGDLDYASRRLEEAWASFHDFGPARAEPTLLVIDARLGLARLGTAGGCDRFGEAVEAALEQDEGIALADLMGREADCRLQTGDAAGSLELARQALALDRQAETASAWHQQSRVARALSALERWDEADDEWNGTLDGLDAQLRALDLEALHLGLGRSAGGLYDEAADALLESSDDDEAALDVFERGRARLLLASVLGMETGIAEEVVRREAEAPSVAPPTTAGSVRTLRSAVRLRSLRDGTFDLDAAARDAGLRPTGLGVEELMRREAASDHARIVGTETVDVAVIRSRLPADITVLSYRVRPERTDLFLTTAGGTERFVIPKSSDQVDDVVRAVLRALGPARASSDTGPAERAGEAAWQALIAPVASRIDPNATLIVVPDGSLYRLPFGALRDGGRWLPERWPVAVVPSLNVLDVLLARSPRGRDTFLGVVDPSGTLPQAGPEVAAAAAHFPHHSVLEGARATPSAVAAAATRADVVHVAAHGQLLSGRQPSYLELADDAGGSILTSDAILDLRLNASLVTLSACRSAVGGQEGGEALVNSLARSFLAAGARTVVGSLWDVDDRGTAELMRRFYDRLAQGHSPVVAMAQAQREMARGEDPELAHPWFWAGFVVVGDPR